MSVNRRALLIVAAILALAAGSGGAVAFAQDESQGTPATSESQGTSGDDSTVSSFEPAGDDSTVSSSEPAGDDTTGTAAAASEVESAANFTG
jgi:hypothetical protein